MQAQKQSSEDLPSDAEKVVGIKNATNNGASGGAASAKKSPDGVHEVAKLPNEPLGDNTETEGSTNFPSNASNSDCGV